MSGPTKILPLLIAVVVMAFAMRAIEVVSGASGLRSTAMAAEEKKDKADKPEAAVEPEPGGEVKVGEANSDSDKAENIGEEGGSKWRDASDEELEYSVVNAKLFQDLRERRKKLDAQERGLVTREAMIRAAEQELDRKFHELSNLRVEIEGLLNQQSEEEQKRIASLVKIYEGMKPKDAARIFDTLDLDVLVAVMGEMSERRLSPVLAAMNAERARTITIMLAEQKKLPELPQ